MFEDLKIQRKRFDNLSSEQKNRLSSTFPELYKSLEHIKKHFVELDKIKRVYLKPVYPNNMTKINSWIKQPEIKELQNIFEVLKEAWEPEKKVFDCVGTSIYLYYLIKNMYRVKPIVMHKPNAIKEEGHLWLKVKKTAFKDWKYNQELMIFDNEYFYIESTIPAFVSSEFYINDKIYYKGNQISEEDALLFMILGKKNISEFIVNRIGKTLKNRNMMFLSMKKIYQ